MFEYSLEAGLISSSVASVEVYLRHVKTTSSLVYIARVDDFDCSIIISACYNHVGKEEINERTGRIFVDLSVGVGEYSHDR